MASFYALLDFGFVSKFWEKSTWLTLVFMAFVRLSSYHIPFSFLLTFALWNFVIALCLKFSLRYKLNDDDDDV